MTTLSPHRLPPNVIEHFYRGGDTDRRAARATPGRIGPEEWLASTVTRWGTDGAGLTDLGAAGLLRDLVAADPDGWLGAAHVARWGASPALLVKLLDAGERLPVHAPPRPHASPPATSDCPFGKTEAWVVLDVPAGGGTVYVGTTPAGQPGRSGPSSSRPRRRTTMLDLLNPLTVNAGDGVVVPASTPHCIDAGLFVVELQEPTDFSILLEWDGFDIDGRPTATSASASTSPSTPCAPTPSAPTSSTASSDGCADDERDDAARAAAAGGGRPVLPRLGGRRTRTPRSRSPAAFSVVVVIEGAGTIEWAGGSEPVARGDAFVVPHAAGPLTFSRGVAAIVAQPPAPDAPEPVERGGAS